MNKSAVGIDPNQDTESVSEKTEETVDEHPWLERLARFGWIAKGAVYALMGLTAFAIGRHRPTNDDASPEGAVAQLRSTSFGTALIWVLVIGLVLYVTWRLLTAALVRGEGIKCWLNRIGYLFSACFYAVLAFTAISALMHEKETKDKNTVERLSGWMLGHPLGRWALFVVGVVVIGIGVFFIIDKGIKRSFLKDLDLAGTPEAERTAITTAGSVGWISRGVVTAAVGFFVAQAAWRYDANDARGFDNAFRELATHQVGSIAVLVTGLALVVYGVFCALIVRHLDLDNVS